MRSRGTFVFCIPPDPPGRRVDRDKAGGLGTAGPRTPDMLPATPPLDLMNSAALAERAGYQVSVLDANATGWSGVQTAAEAAARQPHLVGVRLALPSLRHDLAVANAVKALLPESRVFLFGSVVKTTLPLWMREARADFVVYGEAEAVLPGVLEALEQGSEDLPGVLPLPVRVDAPPAWQYVTHMGGLPFPAWHLLDLGRYTASGQPWDFWFYLSASRGCPYACTMCPYYVLQGHKWRSRPVTEVVAELRYLLERWGARHVQFRDPAVELNPARLVELCRAIIATPELMEGERARVSLVLEGDLEKMKPETLELMARAGVRRIMTGVESADDRVLADIGQPSSYLARIQENVRRCHELGIEVTGFYMVGAPDERWSSVRRTVRFALRLDTDTWLSVLTPYHGTRMRETLLERGLFQDRWDFDKYTGYDPIVSTEYLGRRELALAKALVLLAFRTQRRMRSLRRKQGVRRILAALRVRGELALLLAALGVLSQKDRWSGRRRGTPVTGAARG